MTLRQYQIGFLLSVLCTLTAFWLVWLHLHTAHQFPTHSFLHAVIPVLALAQLVAQLVFFLHLGRASSWMVLTLSFALVIVFFVVGGSLWIMSNLQHTDAAMHTHYQGTPSPQTELD